MITIHDKKYWLVVFFFGFIIISVIQFAIEDQDSESVWYATLFGLALGLVVPSTIMALALIVIRQKKKLRDSGRL